MGRRRPSRCDGGAAGWHSCLLCGMGRPFRWLLLGAVFLAGIWYVYTPRRAWDRFLRGVVFAQEGDLQATVDFPTLRDHLRRDLRAGLAHQSSMPATAMGPVVDQLVGQVMTPRGFASVVTAFGMRIPGAADRDTFDARTVTSFRYRGPSTVDVRIRAASADPSDAGVFTFTRQGIQWRLTRIWGSRLTRLGDSP